MAIGKATLAGSYRRSPLQILASDGVVVGGPRVAQYCVQEQEAAESIEMTPDGASESSMQCA